MENNHKLGLYVSYYLSRFDKEAYQNLGFGKQVPTHKKIGELLKINFHTIRNWRDQFDPIHRHRVGWHQREITQSRINVAKALEDLNEVQVRGIVIDILTGMIKEEPEEEAQLLSIITEDTKDKSAKKFILRGPTGKTAEVFFIQYHNETSIPRAGSLIDCRDLGCGYDFKIESNNIEYYIEVKGMIDTAGGVSFTDKEWQVSTEKGDNFFLCIVKNIGTNPEIDFIQNPASKIKPKKNIYTTIQINWSVTENELNKLDA
ncbi:MAG: DUF3883 domain-containing protein [Ferruginibacter sp.]